MTKDDLFNRITELVPVRYDDSKKDFLTLLNASFQSYIDNLKEFNTHEQNIEKIIFKVGDICKSIISVVEFQYSGLHSKAYCEFSELMIGKIGLLDSFVFYIGDNTPFLYRMRTFESKRGIGFNDMFHIPFKKRGEVSTQRYSIPGYPCLYMGESAYACWEELERPHLDSCMVSRLSATSLTQLIDLRIPTKKDFGTRFEDELCRFPLIISCMVLVSNREDKFKPEYIIPQLLMEFILNTNLDENPIGINANKVNTNPFSFIDGIRYTSVHKNVDFNFPDNIFDNVVIPVVESLSKHNHCPMLCKKFEITNPTCDEYERIKGNNGESYWQKAGYDADEERIRNYEVSIFGTIERSLKDESKYPLNRVIN